MWSQIMSVVFLLLSVLVSPRLCDVALPFGEAARWAASLQHLRVCDDGISEACPVRPEHGGAGFLSTVFTWRYALNNLKAAVVASDGAPAGALDATIQHLSALDQLMEQPMMDAFAQITRSARLLFDQLTPFLEMQPFAMRSLPTPPAVPRRWVWPSDGQTPLADATFALLTGAKMPAIGFGTWRLWGSEAYQPVRWALEAGIRHIDTAEGYANEKFIGDAIRDSGVPRKEIFLATKLSSVPKGLVDIEHTEAVFATQLQDLGMDYVDLYMLHTPPADPAQFQALWSMMELFFQSGHARAIGVSNCDVNELRSLLSFARVPPMYLQNLFKIYKPGEQMSAEEDIVAFAHSHQIAVMGYSVQTEWPHVLPPLEDPHVTSVAASVGRSASQVLHRWALQRGVGVIPKSSRREHIEDIAELLHFDLDETSMRRLDGLATLSETGAQLLVRPSGQEDVYGLHPTTSFLTDSTGGRNVGFPFAAISKYLLGPATRVPPDACRQMCLDEPRCAAWEVCSPYDPQTGCDGCYLIGTSEVAMVEVNGWYAAVERTLP